MMRLLIVASLLVPTITHADTLGLLRCTKGVEYSSTKAVKGKAKALVARDAKQLADTWRLAAMAGKAPKLDFAREMVVGVTGDPTLVVYRVQLDNAANPSALEVHLGPPDSPCGNSERTAKEARAHLVVTPRSDLPVSFVIDTMIDGRIYATSGGEGVSSSPLVTLGGAKLGITKDKAPTREAAERLASDALTNPEKVKLLKGPLDRTMGRIPHGWTNVAVALDDKGVWTVAYDDLKLFVDRATGKVTR
jgi:hypothetical protein